MTSTLAIIQARLGSTRFPQKVLADLHGKPVLRHVVERARAIPGVDRVVVACPLSDYHAIEAVAGFGVGVFGAKGDENDVLRRFALLVKGRMPVTHVLRVTGDCPLLAPDLAGLVLEQVTAHGFPYCASRADDAPTGWPDGLDVEAFTADALLEADRDATDPADREHVTRWLRQRAAYYCPPPCPATWPTVKLSIDTPADLDAVRRVLARIPAGEYGWRATWEAVKAEQEREAA